MPGFAAHRAAALGARKRLVLRAGFGMVTALLVFATVRAFQIQAGLSAEAAQIYRRHARQDEILYRLRRTLWLGATAGRDFLLNPLSGRVATFAAQLADFRTATGRLLDELGRDSGKAALELRPQVEAFWNALAAVPAATRGMDAGARYQFVQHEIAPRRSAVGDVVRLFAETSQKAFEDSELEFTRTRRAAENRLFLTLGLTVLFGLVVAGLSLVRAEELERQAANQYEEVAQARADLQRLSARLMEIQEQERTRLSRELHDEIVQMLATLRLEISRSEALCGRKMPEIGRRLAAARELAERAIQSTRNISLLLRPSLLDDLGLGPALQWQAEDFSRRTGIPCKLHEEGLQGNLAEAVRTCVYRVLQEALHNCEKHSAASEVRVWLRQSPELLHLGIEDNGCGFEPGARPCAGQAPRCGILGMKERAAALGGGLEVHSSPGRGTRLALRLPLATAPLAAHAASGAGR